MDRHGLEQLRALLHVTTDARRRLGRWLALQPGQPPQRPLLGDRILL